MKDWNRFGVMALASVALFALGACGQARAGSEAPQAKPAAVQAVVADTLAIADAGGDNGPGCAESLLDSTTQD